MSIFLLKKFNEYLQIVYVVVCKRPFREAGVLFAIQKHRQWQKRVLTNPFTCDG